MSIRIACLCLLVGGLALYAWRDWFKALCGLFVLMAVLEHPDMPKNIMGVQGLNPWNILMFSICLAWLASRRRERLVWDMPARFNLLLLAYLGVILFGFLRAVFDRQNIEHYSVTSMISDQLINTVKWVVPGLLLFDGCRSRQRLAWATGAVLLVYVVLSVQVIRSMPWSAAFGGSEAAVKLTRQKFDRRIGYNACDVSPMLAGGFWGLMAFMILIRRRLHRLVVLAAGGMVLFAQALTQGRAGYLAWGATGLALGAIRWRKGLLLLPVVPLLLVVLLPGVAERMLEGIGETSVSGESTVDEFAVSAGRSQVWPHVLDEISQSPVIGQGRLAMQRTGLTRYLGARYGESEALGHPHNVYLEWILDNGLLGFIPVMWFYVLVVVCSARLFRDPDPWYAAVGGIALSSVLVQLVAGFSAQHFYPSEGTVPMWACVFLMLRVHLARQGARVVAVRPVGAGLQLPAGAAAVR